MCAKKIQIKTRSNKKERFLNLCKRLQKMEENGELFVVYILDEDSKNNLCRQLNEHQLDADSYQITHLEKKIPVFYVNTEIIKWIFRNWEKAKNYEKILHKNEKDWKELKI